MDLIHPKYFSYFFIVMEKKHLIILCIALLSTITMTGQDFKGIVLDAKQRPLKGMKVWKKNSTESIKTDKMGVFTFSGLSPSDTLVISVSKKEEIVISIDKLSQVSVKIEKTYFTLFDGVKEEKREYTKIKRIQYSSNVLVREQIEKLSVNSIYELLKGSIPGVTVVDGKITIRGGNSFDLNTEPLFVVDGTIYESSSDVDATVSISDIDRIEVQKDGSMYGARGSNGVIIITTNKK